MATREHVGEARHEECGEFSSDQQRNRATERGEDQNEVAWHHSSLQGAERGIDRSEDD